jgi:hypothetical protein
MNIGQTDERNPAGAGYRIMTPEGLKVYDVTERAEFISEKNRCRAWLRSPCRRCTMFHSSHCFPPADGLCSDFKRAPKYR